MMLGENSLIFERFPYNNVIYERVLPNYFNDFLKQPAHSENDLIDKDEMKYLQNAFKTRIEMMK